MDIQISYYGFLYFDEFGDIVDQLGGVTVEVPEGTYYNGVRVPAGKEVKVNGEQALTLARCRHGDPPDQGAYVMGDYQRTLNQRNLIKSICKEVLSRDAIEYPALLTSLSECVETNMPITTVLDVARSMKGFDTSQIEAAQLPEAGYTIGGEWFAALYDDVFQVVKENFKNGNKPFDGLDGFDITHNGDDQSSHCVDGQLYAYCYYQKIYGDFKNSASNSSSVKADSSSWISGSSKSSGSSSSSKSSKSSSN